MKLSVIIPAYNEENTIYALLKRVSEANISDASKEIIVVNDASTDETEKLVKTFIQDYPHTEVKYLKHDLNEGKGQAVSTAKKAFTGDFVVIQDADLEYDPNEYANLLKPLLKGVADVVYGSRFVGGYPHRVLFFWHSIGNKFLTMLSNMFTNLNLTDMETCYKMFRAEVFRNITIQSKDFGIEPEITAKISRIPGIRIYEVGISYYGRTYAEGKKIDWKDGVKALYYIFKYNLFKK